MSAVTAVARKATKAPAELEREVLTRIARGGLLICETELGYQLHRCGHEHPDLIALLAELEHRGLIESEMHYRLTPSGAARVPDSDRPASRGVSSIPWGSASARGTLSNTRRPSTVTAIDP